MGKFTVVWTTFINILGKFMYMQRRRSATVSDKSYERNCYLDNFVLLLPSPSHQCCETMSKICVTLCYGFATLYRWRGGILNKLFRILIIYCHWLSQIFKDKRKVRFYACCFRKLKCALMSLIMLRYTLSWS